METPPRRWLRAAEVAELLDVHEATIWKLIKRGQLPSVKRPGLGRLIPWTRLKRASKPDSGSGPHGGGHEQEEGSRRPRRNRVLRPVAAADARFRGLQNAFPRCGLALRPTPPAIQSAGRL